MRGYNQRKKDDYEAVIGLIMSETVPGTESLIGVIKFIMDRQFEVLSRYPLFEIPTSLREETLTFLLS